MDTIVPHIGQLEVRTGGNQMQAVFAAGDVELNLKDLGTGVEQLLMTLVVGLTEAPPLTLVIEEPETNLHHAAQRALLGLLKDWSADRQIVAATHSPVMLDWSPGGERLWHVIKEPDHSVVRPVDADPAGLLAALGVRLSDVLSATRVLVLEGPSDEDVLEAWFPDILRSPAVAVLHGGGGDNARHADRLAEWLARVDKIGLRRVLYLRDRDELSPRALKTLRPQGQLACCSAVNWRITCWTLKRFLWRSRRWFAKAKRLHQGRTWRSSSARQRKDCAGRSSSTGSAIRYSPRGP